MADNTRKNIDNREKDADKKIEGANNDTNRDVENRRRGVKETTRR